MRKGVAIVNTIGNSIATLVGSTRAAVVPDVEGRRRADQADRKKQLAIPVPGSRCQG
jgi:hypothetical protein